MTDIDLRDATVLVADHLSRGCPCEHGSHKCYSCGLGVAECDERSARLVVLGAAIVFGRIRLTAMSAEREAALEECGRMLRLYRASGGERQRREFDETLGRLAATEAKRDG